MQKEKIIRITTVPISMNKILKGQLKYLNTYYDVLGVSKYVEKDFIEIEEREKIRMIAVPFERNISIVKDIICLFKLFVLFRKEKPLIVHSITPKAGLLSMIAGFFACVPIRMHTFTGLLFPTKTGISQKILIVMDKLLCFFATNIIPEGKGVERDLIDYKITSKRLQVLANGNVNGIDLDYFDFEQISTNQKDGLRKELGILESEFVFVYVGRLVGDKGIDELIEAFEFIEQMNVRLLLVGPFEQNNDPLNKETIRRIENNSKIISVGSQKDVRPYFSISNCFVFPSYREGFPNVVLEAGAMGLPSIVTNINGSNEIILNEYNGIVIPVKDTVLLFDAMKRMMTDEKLYNYLKDNSRKIIVDNYEQKKVWSAIHNEYKNLLKKRKIYSE